MALVRSRNTNFERTFLRLVSAELYPLGIAIANIAVACWTPDIVFHKFYLPFSLIAIFGTDAITTDGQEMNAFWREKSKRNMERDRQVARKLRRQRLVGASLWRASDQEGGH